MSFSSRVIAGLAWTAGGRFLGQLVAWGVSIFVMRILDPGDYGLLAMATVLISFLALFAELGLGWAVVHAREIDIPTLRKVFGLVILINGGLFALVFATAPLVAAFYGEARLTNISRVIAIEFLIAVFSVIPDAQLRRELEFKRRSIVDLSATVVNGAATLALALYGAGVWSLVYGSLMSELWRTAGINVVRPFSHLPSFAFTGLGRLFAFGGYLALSRILLFVYMQADVLIGGRVLGREQLGYYSVGMQLASLPMQRISAVLNEVVFPAFAHIQDDRERVGRYVLQGIRLVSLFAFPVFWGIASVAPEVVRLLIGDKWEPAIVPLQLLAFMMPVRMVGQLMPPALQGIGRAKLVARNQLVTGVVMIGAFLVGIQYGIIGLSAAWLVAFPVVFLENLRTWLPALGLRAMQLISAMLRPALTAAGMCGVVAVARDMTRAVGLPGLVVLVSAGVASYAALSLAFNRAGMRDIRAILRRRADPAEDVRAR